jgi:5-methylcytosine-specific restriction endonuclease McrA
LEERRAGPGGGRPARPLFATPRHLARADPSCPVQDYILVIRAMQASLRSSEAGRYTARMGRALVLNASDAPLAVVPARRAVVLVLKDKAEVVATNGMVFRSATISMEAPSVVRLRRYVRVPYRPHAPLTRRAVFARDDWSCQYCTAPAENLDHVVPRSRGGTHSWENVVASCRRCNAKKENRTPQEAGFHLARRPFAPTDGFRLTLGRLEPGWDTYLG